MTKNNLFDMIRNIGNLFLLPLQFQKIKAGFSASVYYMPVFRWIFFFSSQQKK